MFETSSRLNPLESRKELLLAESELNRARMIEDVAALSADIHALADRAKSFDTIASSAAVLVSGLAAFQRGKSADADAKPSWLRTIVKGAGLVSNLWLAFRPKGRDRSGN
jgi:hypothetical protein